MSALFLVFRAPVRGTFGRCPKSTQKDNLNLRFKNPHTLFRVADLWPFTTRSRGIFDFAAYDVSTVPLAPLPLTFSTVESEALFGVGISGSGADAETILLTKRKRKFYANVWYAFAILCNV